MSLPCRSSLRRQLHRRSFGPQLCERASKQMGRGTVLSEVKTPDCEMSLRLADCMSDIFECRIQLHARGHFGRRHPIPGDGLVVQTHDLRWHCRGLALAGLPALPASSS